MIYAYIVKEVGLSETKPVLTLSTLIETESKSSSVIVFRKYELVITLFDHINTFHNTEKHPGKALESNSL